MKLDAELVDPLHEWYKVMEGGIDLNDIPGTRKNLLNLFNSTKGSTPPVDGISIEDRRIPGPEGADDVFVRIYKPNNRLDMLPALLWMHSGGYVMGNVEREDLLSQHLAKVAQCVVVSVEYRLAPEHPYPAALEDCYATLKWLSAHDVDFGVDRSRIAVGGNSAGGGLAASLALLARDRSELDISFQLLVYPMIDDRTIPGAEEDASSHYLWAIVNNRMAWAAYLGHVPGGDGVYQYASAARAENIVGLPPTFIQVGDLDLFLDENIVYARRLLAAGVHTELHIYSGGCHGFNVFAPNAAISQRINEDRDIALKRMLH